MIHGWNGSRTGRCPKWEDRPVRGEHASSKIRTRIVQVRCMRPVHHRGKCQWMGKPFGYWKATA